MSIFEWRFIKSLDFWIYKKSATYVYINIKLKVIVQQKKNSTLKKEVYIMSH